MNWFKRKPKKLNETTRLYALYGESANLEFLDNQDKDTIQRVETVENNLQQTNNNLNQTNQNLNQTNNNLNQTNNKVQQLENKVNNLPTVDTSQFTTKDYVDRQDSLVRSEALIAQGTANRNEKEIQKTNSALSNLADRVVDLALEHKQFAKKDTSNTFTETNTFNNTTTMNNNLYFKNNNQEYGRLELYRTSDFSIKAVNGDINLTPTPNKRVVIWGDGLDMSSKKIRNVSTPTSDTDAATKAYVDRAVAGSGKKFNFFYRSNRIVLNKKDVSPSRDMYWYDIHSNQTLTTTVEGLTPNINYYYLVLLQTINNNPCETYIVSNVGTTNSRGELDIFNQNLSGKTIVSWRDFNPGTAGDFGATLGFKILCIAL